jgi:hypothetical protein
VDETNKALRELDMTDLEVDFFAAIHNPHTPMERGWQNNIPYKLEKARKIILALNYDYLMIVEDDVVPPPNTIRRLVELNQQGQGDVITGIYQLKPRDRGRLSSYKVKFMENPHKCSAVPGHRPHGAHNCSPVTQINFLMPGKDFNWGDVLQVDIVSYGCTLIPGYVLEKLNFMEVDVGFSMKCRELGFTLITDTGVKCEHKDINGVM